MNGFAERRTSETSGARRGREELLTWEAASAMLPLAGRIAGDIVQHVESLTRFVPEKADLDARRQELDWPGRHRRYELQREIARLEEEMRQVRAELESLGVVLLDAASGLVGFPTIVNEQRAFFSWKPGESCLAYWNYLGHSERHSVPPAWTKQGWEVRPGRRPRSSR